MLYCVHLARVATVITEQIILYLLLDISFILLVCDLYIIKDCCERH